MRRGYTLVEVLIVVAIVGIIGAFAFGIWDRSRCAVGHWEATGGMTCRGDETWRHCTPDRDWVCDQYKAEATP